MKNKKIEKNPSKPLIGLLGAIGSGKTSVAQMFAQLGCGIIDADTIAKQALDLPDIKQQLTTWWGNQILTPDGQINRHNVSQIVFSDPTQLAKLEQLIHPIVLTHRKQLIQQYQTDPNILAIIDDTPLLLEKGLDHDCHTLVYIDVSPQVQLQRISQSRHWTPEELQKRQNNQMPLDRKRQKAHYCIDNSADRNHCLVQVRQILSQIITNKPPA